MDAHAQLYVKVARLLWEDWDPIGVNSMNGPDDEYNMYVPEVVAMLERDARVEDIADHLTQIATVRMGLSIADPKHCHDTAIKLKALNV